VFLYDSQLTGAWVHDNPCTGINALGGFILESVVANNTGASSDGIYIGYAGGGVEHTVLYKNGRDGVRNDASYSHKRAVRNCVLLGNGGYGIKSLTAIPAYSQMFDYNAFGSCTGSAACGGGGGTCTGCANTSGSYSGLTAGANDVTFSMDPFTDAGALGHDDFTLNATANGGAVLRGASYPGAVTTTGTGKADIGALQHADPAAGGPCASATWE
jgi:hypothetical protein